MYLPPESVLLNAVFYRTEKLAQVSLNEILGNLQGVNSFHRNRISGLSSFAL